MTDHSLKLINEMYKRGSRTLNSVYPDHFYNTLIKPLNPKFVEYSFLCIDGDRLQFDICFKQGALPAMAEFNKAINVIITNYERGSISRVDMGNNPFVDRYLLHPTKAVDAWAQSHLFWTDVAYGRHQLWTSHPEFSIIVNMLAKYLRTGQYPDTMKSNDKIEKVQIAPAILVGFRFVERNLKWDFEGFPESKS